MSATPQLPQPLKVYILIKDTVPVGHAVNSAAHAALALYLDYGRRAIVDEWVSNSFRKVSCKVSAAQFEEAKQYGDFSLITESALGGEEVAMAFVPRAMWPEFFKTLKLYSEFPLD